MTPADAELLRRIIENARAIALARAGPVPQTAIYHLVLEQLAAVEATLAEGPAGAYEASRLLGRLAARELDDLDGEPTELAELIFGICHSLRRLAGLPYYA